MTPPPEEQANLNALSNLLALKGLDAGDFIDVINALSNIKQRDAAKEEKEWASYLFKDGSIIGLNETVLHQYIDWLCMSRRKAIGLPYENAGKNPIAGWTQAWMQSESVQVAPQEHEITSYKIGASKNDLDDMDLGDFSL